MSCRRDCVSFVARQVKLCANSHDFEGRLIFLNEYAGALVLNAYTQFLLFLQTAILKKGFDFFNFSVAILL